MTSLITTVREGTMTTHEIRIDADLPLVAQPETGHNRWHPAIPPIVRCSPGDEVILETRDALDGPLNADSTLEDLAKIDLNIVHPLTGPVFIEAAEPGDILVAEILEVIAPSFGFTVQLPGFGFLRDEFPDPYLVKWDLAEGWGTSDEIPGVRIPGAPFMGVIGLSPSQELMATIAAREADLAGRCGIVALPHPARAV